jgi:hypothetical protein
MIQIVRTKIRTKIRTAVRNILAKHGLLFSQRQFLEIKSSIASVSPKSQRVDRLLNRSTNQQTTNPNKPLNTEDSKCPQIGIILLILKGLLQGKP